MKHMENHLAVSVIWTIVCFITTGNANGSDRECIDYRQDCTFFSSNCNTAPSFIITGCPMTCGICPVHGINEEFYSTPIISLVHEEGSVSAIRGANVSCSVYIRSSGNSTLIFQCNGGPDHLENMGDTDGSHITSSLYIPVQSDYSWVKCTCVLKYMSEGHIRNQTITQRLTLRGQNSKPTFYVSSTSGSGLNITVYVNQTVTFTCNSTAKAPLNLNKGGQLLISHVNLKENASYESDENASLTHTIKGVQCNDSGEYQCLAVGFHGTVRSSVTLSVQCDDETGKDDDESPKNGANQTSYLPSVPQCSFLVTLIVVGVSGAVVTCVLLIVIKHIRDKNMIYHLQTGAQGQVSYHSASPESRVHNSGPNESATNDSRYIFLEQQLGVFADAYTDEQELGHVRVSETNPCPNMNNITELSFSGIIYTDDENDDILDVSSNESALALRERSRDNCDAPVPEDALMYAKMDFADTHHRDCHPTPMLHKIEYAVIDFQTLRTQ